MTKKKKSFTLIEIMLALVVFGLGIIVLLRAIVYFVGQGDDVKKRAQAVLLAKEAMDIVYNQRDTNLRRGVVWNCVKIDKNDLQDACSEYFQPGSRFRVGYNTATAGGYTIEGVQGTEDIQLLRWQQGTLPSVYNYQQGATSEFRREVIVDKAVLQGNELSPDNVVKVTVKVYYVPNSDTRSVVLESYLAAGEKVQ